MARFSAPSDDPQVEGRKSGWMRTHVAQSDDEVYCAECLLWVCQWNPGGAM